MNHTRWMPAIGLALSMTLTGCGGSSLTGSGGSESLHGGTSQALPEDAGYVEVVVEPVNPDAPEKSRGKVVAYFSNRAGNGPLLPAPTDVSFTDQKGKSYPMKAASGSEFESGIVSLPIGADPTGTLAAKLGGTDVSLVLGPR